MSLQEKKKRLFDMQKHEKALSEFRK